MHFFLIQNNYNNLTRTCVLAFHMSSNQSCNTPQAPLQEAIPNHACSSVIYALFPTDAGDNWLDFMIRLRLRTSPQLSKLGTCCHLSPPQVCCAPIFNQGNLVSHLLQPFKSFKVSQLLPVKLLSSGLPWL